MWSFLGPRQVCFELMAVGSVQFDLFAHKALKLIQIYTNRALAAKIGHVDADSATPSILTLCDVVVRVLYSAFARGFAQQAHFFKEADRNLTRPTRPCSRILGNRDCFSQDGQNSLFAQCGPAVYPCFEY